METRSYPTPDSPASGSGAEPTPLQAEGLVLVPLAAAAALDPSVFSKVNASEAIPACWRTFAVGNQIKIAGDDEKVKWEAVGVSVPLRVSEFVKDMILRPTCQSHHCHRQIDDASGK